MEIFHTIRTLLSSTIEGMQIYICQLTKPNSHYRVSGVYMAVSSILIFIVSLRNEYFIYGQTQRWKVLST